MYALRGIGTFEAQLALLKIVQTENFNKEQNRDIYYDFNSMIRPEALRLLIADKKKYPEMTPEIEAAYEKYKDQPGFSFMLDVSI